MGLVSKHLFLFVLVCGEASSCFTSCLEPCVIKHPMMFFSLFVQSVCVCVCVCVWVCSSLPLSLCYLCVCVLRCLITLRSVFGRGVDAEGGGPPRPDQRDPQGLSQAPTTMPYFLDLFPPPLSFILCSSLSFLFFFVLLVLHCPSSYSCPSLPFVLLPPPRRRRFLCSRWPSLRQ